MMNYNGGPSTSFSVRNGTQTTSRMTNFIRGKANNLNLPNVGDLKWSVATQDSNRWLICDGRSLSRTSYLPLFNVIGTSFGSDSSDTFNLPDCRGRVMGAIGQGSDLSLRTLGEAVGEEKHELSISEMPSHNHSGVTSSSGVHNHTGTTNTTGSHTHTSNAVGGQGNYGLVLANGSNTVIDTDGSNGELNVWTTPFELIIDSNGDHSHTLNVNNNGAHTHTISSQGSSLAHNNMQPTLFISNVFIYSG